MTTYHISATSLHRLRRRLLAAGPGVAAEILQDAGFATGEAMCASWSVRVAERTGVDDSGRLDTNWFGPLLGELCASFGWGSLAVDTLGERALLLSSPDWAEAEPMSTDHAGCYFSCGCLAAFLTAQAGAPLAVLEVECRSCGSEQCRFLAGSTETLAAVYDLIAAGRPWREAFAADELPG
jgi:hypothetical protein